uniref:CUB domain-containing protein n=1 Tax=Timema poppense TaxID=170557 RepID=A0A7R9HBA3_TIMPO|nr:unnamed protein product [Timema poppensis]
MPEKLPRFQATLQVFGNFVAPYRDITDHECTKEYVELFDGGSQNAKLLGRYCTRKPSSLMTTGNMLTVHYFTETTDPHNGFLANIAISTSDLRRNFERLDRDPHVT